MKLLPHGEWGGTALGDQYASVQKILEGTLNAIRTVGARRLSMRDISDVIPARYCTGYMGDMDLPALVGDMDFSVWFEAYLQGHWYTFDARHDRPRRGRILMLAAGMPQMPP